jgi:hypothetical protein
MVEVIGTLLLFALAVLVVTVVLLLIGRAGMWLRGRGRPRYMSKPARTSVRVWPPKDGGGRAA